MTKRHNLGPRIELVPQEEVSVCGGVVLFKELMDKFKIREMIDSLPFPKSKHINSYDSRTIIETFLANVWLGGNRFVHCEVVRRDRVISEAFGWHSVPSTATITRFFNKFTWSVNDRVFPSLFKHLFSFIETKDVILDIDSHVIPRYGSVEGAEVGYNPRKPGRRSHHPIVAFIDQFNMCVNGWLRQGRTDASNNLRHFIEETLDILGNISVKLVRADSGFCNQRALKAFEDNGLKYIVRARMSRNVKRTLLYMLKWRQLGEGFEVGEGQLKLWKWKESRRIVAVRLRKDVFKHSTGESLLIGGVEVRPQWVYHAFVTNTYLSPEEVWQLYKGRANVENRIKELVHDFGIDQFNVKNFWGTEAAFRLCLFAYNIVVCSGMLF